MVNEAQNDEPLNDEFHQSADDVLPIADIERAWATARKQQDEERERQHRAATRKDAPRRIIEKAKQWKNRVSVKWNWDLARRIGALAKLWKAIGRTTIVLPDGLVAAQAQWMLREAAVGRAGWRRRVATRIEELYYAAAAAGDVGIPIDDPQAIEPSTVPPRDRMTYFRDHRSPNLFEDIESALGLRPASPEVSAPSDNADELDDILPPWHYADLLPVPTTPPIDPATVRSLSAIANDFCRASQERDLETIIRLCRSAAERAGRSLAFDYRTNWTDLWTGGAEFQNAQQSLD